MPFAAVPWNPTDRQLTQFGVIAAAALPLLTWLWGGGSAWILGATAIGIVLAMVGLLRPRRLKWVFIGLTLLVLPIGLVAGEIAMLGTYYLVVAPIGLAFRAAGRDRLQLRIDRGARSYWQEKPQPRDMAGYFRQS